MSPENNSPRSLIAQELFEYVQDFYGNRPGGYQHFHLSFQPEGQYYYFGFYRGNRELTREYRIYPDKLELTFPKRGKFASYTQDQHADFIIAQLSRGSVQTQTARIAPITKSETK